MNREHQLAYDNQSPDESMTDYEVVHEALADEMPDVPEWLLDAMAECLVNDDAAYMQHQLAKHCGELAQKAISGGDRP